MSGRGGGSRPKAVHLTSVHTTFDARIFQKECRALRDAGYDVTLVARASGDVTVDGIHVVAVPPPSSRVKRLFWTVPQVFVAALRQRGDVYHFHDPELLPVGAALALFTRARVVWDCHEDITHFSERTWIPKRLQRLVEWFVLLVQRTTMRRFDAIVSAEPKIMQRFPEEKRVLVQNFPTLEGWPDPTPPYADRPHLACYVGDITAPRGARDMVEAMGVAGPTGVGLVLVGRMNPPALDDELSALVGWRYIDFRGYLNREAVVDALTMARFGLILLHPVRHYQLSQPTKLFEYMAAGIPVVAYDLPSVGELVRRHECGILTRPMDPVEAGQAIIELARDECRAAEMGERGREAVKRHYSWSTEAQKLLSLYEKLLAGRR